VSRRPRLFLACAGGVLALDQLTKWLVSTYLLTGQPVRVLGDVVRLTLVHNRGAAFGLFPGSRVPFIIVSVLAIAVVLYLFRRDAYRNALSRVLLGGILGGALGNLIDRVRLGYVVDFIEVGIGSLRWPVFNVADSAVTLGVITLAWILTRPGRHAAAPAEDTSGSSVASG
jgi:signal peptidase II